MDSMIKIEENRENTGDVSGKNWYAVHTRSRHEKKVDTELKGKGVESFLPLYETLSRRRDRKKVIDLPLFSGYLFVHIVPERERILDVLKVKGVVRIIGRTSTELHAIPEAQIEAVRRFVESDVLISGHPYIKEGSRVRVKCGPLTGVEGVLQEKRGKHRLIIAVDMLQQAVSTEISVDEVEPV
ncbi:MAG: UpxY family transcription antiterminator [Deltaproteobacteria bacterium]|nr:UpxY family transcription antiterminator [Deltaproteobacteria bacterium]